MQVARINSDQRELSFSNGDAFHNRKVRLSGIISRTSSMLKNPLIVLSVLTGLNLFNYLDRMVVSAVLKPMSEELNLTGFQAGFLSTAFLLGYFTTSPIFGWAADRGNRTKLIAVGVVIWSLATIGSGLAKGAGSLIFARVLVGLGEASYATIAPTMIDDISPPEKKGRWLAIFFTAAPVGSALGYVLGGTISHHHGWRAAYFVAGAPGLLLALASLFLADPPRKTSEKTLSVLQTARVVVRFPTFLYPALGYAAYTFALAGLAFWGPSYIGATYHVDEKQANLPFGIATVVAGIIGSLIGGALGDRARKKAELSEGQTGVEAQPSRLDSDPNSEIKPREVAAYLKVCATSTLIALPALLACLYAKTLWQFIGFAALAQVALFMSTSPINAATLRGVPADKRASAMALLIFAIHLLGDLWSPPLVGFIKDQTSFRNGMLALPIGFAVAGAIWWFGAKTILRPRTA